VKDLVKIHFVHCKSLGKDEARRVKVDKIV